jgi:iron complex transport system substrate-binding protein
VFSLGCGNRLVGRTSYCDRPKEALEIKDVGGFSTVEIQRIRDLMPDLVIGTSLHENLLAPLRAEKICVQTIEPCPSFLAHRQIEHIGKILGVFESSSMLSNRVQKEIENVHSVAKRYQSRKVCYFCDVCCPMWYDCNVVKSITYLNCTLSGRKRQQKLNAEETIMSIVTDRPDVFIIPSSHAEHAERYLRTSAPLVKYVEKQKPRISCITSNLLGRPGPSSGTALQELLSAIFSGETK